MTRSSVTIAAAVAGCLTLSACGGSSPSASGLNPFGWFKKNDEATEAAAPVRELSLTPKRGYTNYVDPRGLIGDLLSVNIDRTPDGAIVRATGRTGATGYFDADLVRVATGDNVFIYEFRVRRTEDTAVTGQVISAATELTAAEYAWARRVIVRGTNGSLTAKR